MNLSGDQYVVTWASSGQDGSGWGVYSRLFNRADSTLYVTSETDVEIPDTGSATATLNVSNNAVIADLNVQIEFSHDAPGDLTVELISPDGTVVELFSNVPSAYSNGTLATGSNFSGTTLDDEAAIAITNADSGAVPPFADTYQPTGSLAAFDGENVNGQWQLRITDSNGNDRSSLPEQWTLIVEQTPATEDEFRVNTTAVGNQSYPSVAMDHQGEFIVTWSGFGNQTEHEDLSGSGVFLQRYEATGERIGNESRVNMSTEGDQKYSSVASDGVGNYYIAFTGVARDSNGASMLGMTDVFVQTSSSSLVLVDNDPPIVTQVQLDDGTRLLEGDVIAASTGSLVVVLSESMSTTGMTSVENASNWSLKRNGNELPDAIESVEFEWNELTRKYEATVNFVDDVLPLTEGEYQLMLSSVVTDGANALDGDRDGIAGSDPTTTTQQGYQFDFIVSDSSDGATVGAESRVNVETEYIDQFSTPSGTGTALETTSTTLAVDHDGDYVVVWESENSSLDGSYDVYARRFTSVGEALDSTEFLVNTETTLNQVNPSVAMDNYGNFVVVWATAGEDFAFSTDIKGQLCNNRGEAQGQEFQVNDESLAGISPPADGNFQINPSVAMSGATGNFVVTWEVVTAQQNGIVTDTVIAARQFAADGSAIASEFQADTGVGTGGAEVERVARNAQVTVADDDSFIIVWESYTGVDYDVFFQTFASTGAALTSGQANMAQFTGQQVNPSVAVDVDGNFGIVFNGAGAEANALYPNDPTLYADADDEGVWVRSYDSTSTAVSVESRVNVTSAGIQQFPTIAMEPDGDYVVAWSGQGVGDHSGISVRRYNESVDLVGPQVTELRLTDGTIVDDEEAVPRPTELVVVFDEDMLNSGEDAVTNPENWILRRDGVEMPDSTVSSITYSLNPETNKYEAVFHFNGYLPAGDYTLTAVAPVPDVPEIDDVEGNSGLRDAAGNPLQATGSLPSGTDSTLAFRINTDLGPGSGGTGDVLPANFSVTRSDGDSATPKVDNAQLFSATSGSVATDADGDHIVVLKATDDSGTDRLYYRRFDAAGNPTSDLISVLDGDANASDFEGDIQEDAAVAVDADGDFIITWTNTRDGNADIFARRFSADGQALGDAFQVNDTQISAQSPSPGVASTNPSVAMAPNGNFAVVWDQITAQTNGVITDSQIVAKYFDSQGSELVSEFRVDDGSGTGGGDLYRTARNPQVGLDENGNMTVVWEAYGADDTGVDSSYGVFFQQFEVLIVEDIDLTVSSTVTITAGTSGQVNQADFAGEQVNPGVGVDADGDFTIVWNGAGGESDPLDPTNSDLFVNLDTEGVWLRNYDPLATPSSGQSRVNKTMEGVQNYPAIAMEPDGDYVVVWQGKGVGDQHGVFARQYDTAGDSAGPLATELRTATGERISEGESLFNNPATLTVVFNEEMSTSGGATGYHSVENPNNWALVDGQGNEQVSAISEIEFSLNPATNKWEAFLTFNSALYPNGLENGYYTLVARSQLQDLAGNALAMTGLQTSGTGLSYVPATSPTGGMGFSFRVHELTPGDPNSGDLDPIVNTTEYTDATDSAVARNADGQYVVVWVEEVGTETVDPTDSTSTVITYSTEIYARMFDANDEPVTNRLGSDDAFLVNSLTTGDQVTPDVSIDDEGNFVVVWAGVGILGLGEQDDAGIFGQLFNANGDAVGGQFGINQTDDGIQSSPAVAMDDDGNFVVTWESHEQGGIMARKFDVSGASTNEFVVNSTTGNSHKTPDVAIDNEGEFAITWAADQQDSGSFGVFAQRYSADAAKVGDEFQVNQFETNQQEKPRIAMSDDGVFVITWQSFGQDAFGGYGVYARCYDGDGNAAGSEFQVNDYTASYQFEPAVAMDSNGDFVITWSRYGQEGDGGEQYGIFAKMHNADGSLFVVPGQTDPLGEFRINAIADGGGNDYARIFDTSSVDKFVGTPTMSRMYSTQADYDVSAELFDLTLAKSVNGGNDIARFFDSDDKEIFLGTADKAEFSGDDFEIIARKFEKVEATATPGTGDIAKLRDTEGDDHLVADADSAKLYSKDGDEIELLYEVFAFDQVKTYRSEGNDTKDVADVVDYLLLDDGWLDDY